MSQCYTEFVKTDSYANNDKFIGRGLDSFGLKTRLIEAINSRDKDLSLLEIGCGKGNLILNLAALYPNLKLTGINKSINHGTKDQSELEMKAYELGIKKSQLSFQVAEATNLPFSSNSFDIVISHVTFLHIINKAKAIEEAYRVLKPNGTAIISLGSYAILRKHGHPTPTFYKTIRRRLGADFNPRFLIESENKLIALSSYIRTLQRAYKVDLEAIKFVSESQRGIAHWLIFQKDNEKALDLKLKFLPKESKELTQLYSHNNPVNWGAIDKYELLSNW